MDDARPRVFLVDDDAAVRRALSRLIESEGYLVEAYASAEDFLAAGAAEAHGCAIIDLSMPGMNGMRLQEEMVRRGFRLPIIFLTGYSTAVTSLQAARLGAVAVLTKPVAGSDLFRSIAAAMASAERRPA